MGKGKKRGKLRIFIILCLCVFILIPAVFVGISFIGRIAPSDIIPGNFSVYADVPDLYRFARNITGHEAFPRMLQEPSLAFLAPVISDLRKSGLLDNFWLRGAANGKLQAALLPDNTFLAAWDMGLVSSIFRLLPFLAGQITVPNLYYVQAGKNSRFEYRLADGQVFFIAGYKNLLVMANNSKLFESVIAGTSRAKDARPAIFASRDYDAALLAAPDFAVSAMAAKAAPGEPGLSAFLEKVKFPGLIELALSFAPGQLDIKIMAPLNTEDAAFAALISRPSNVTDFLKLLPEKTQVASLLSAGRLPEILDAARAVSGPSLDANIRKAGNTANMLFGMNLDELAFSWMGDEFAAFGIEGRPYPVFAVKIADEARRQEVFGKLFASALLSDDISTVLDGTRIPRVRLPGFLDSLLRFWDVVIPTPYYYVHEGFLFVSESSDSLIAAIGALRRNTVLPKTDVWKALAKGSSDRMSFCLFYSLDRSLPFFLKGNSAVLSLLRLYRQGLLRGSFENGSLALTMAAIPGSAKGISPVSGYPMDLKGKIGNQVYAALSGKKGESRILLTRGTQALAIDPADGKVYEYEAKTGELWCIPADGVSVPAGSGIRAWVVTRQGQVALVDGGMKPLPGFPLVTGARLSSAPAAFGGRLYLTEDSSVYVLDAKGEINRIAFSFDGALRSAPSFLSASGKTYIGLYPKSFAGELWLTDGAGKPYPGWPAVVSGIAFGSPLVYVDGKDPRVAFITQGGSLYVFNAEGGAVPGFPVELPGVFHIQPVWDGEYLWILSVEGVLYQIARNGDSLTQTTGLRAEEGILQAVDIDSDGVSEIFLTGDANAMHAYTRALTPIGGFPLPVWGRAAFADFSGAGLTECVGAGMDNLVYRWRFNK